MTHTLIKRGFKGFTLIELLVVIAIIGLLSTIIAAPIQNARKKARDSKKIAEIKAVQLALDQYAEANAGKYPTALDRLAPTYMPQLPGFAATSSATVNPRDMFAYAPYLVNDTGGNSIASTTFAYHLGVHLENFSQGLDNDRDCAGAENISGYTTMADGTSTCAFYPAAGADISAFYTTVAGTRIAGMIRELDVTAYDATLSDGGGTLDDFSGADGDIATCNGTEDCVFDVTQQQ